jgi:tRNA(adenine34) deaminase
MENTKDDSRFMGLALEQARLSFSEGNFPVGAVLVINGKLIEGDRNLLQTNSDWISHAEIRLLIKHSSLIKKSKKENAVITLYTTLEPCLMCLGTSVLHRISRIIYACPDLYSGATCIKHESLPIGYQIIYPKIEAGALKKESQDLLIKYMDAHISEKWQKASELMKSF